MIAQISHTGNLAGLVNYHNTKILKGHAEIIGSQLINTSTKSNITASFNSYAAFSNDKSPHVHISINLHADDRTKIGESTYIEIAEEYLVKMGYGEQPYLLVKHDDQAHPHFHIITSRIKDNGTKVATWGERYRSQNISRDIEAKLQLTQVSNIKREPKQTVAITNGREYAKYLRSSIKEALGLKPKRFDDFANLLETRYGINVYRTPKKGMGFALMDETSRRIQNGFGTKGIGASSLDRQWSGTAIGKQLRRNFETAPKRYRNLKGTEKTLKGELVFFNTISPDDFRQVFEKMNLGMYRKEGTFLILDTKGKNLYSDKDLKQIDFNKMGRTTQLKDPATSGLFLQMAQETLAHYKQEISPYLKKSVFLDYVAVRSTYLEQVANSETFQRYDSLFGEVDRKQLDTFLGDFHTRSLNETGALKAGEFHGEQMDIKMLGDFAAKHNLDRKRLTDLFELNTYKDHYTHFTAARNTLALIRTLEGSKDERISPNLVLQYPRYFEMSELAAETAAKVDGIVSKAYIRSKLFELRRSYTTAERLLEDLNTSGITLRQGTDGNDIIATVSGHGHETKLDQLKGIFDTELLAAQRPTASLEDMTFNNAIRSENLNWAFSLYEKGNLSDRLKEKYQGYPPFINIEKERTFRKNFKGELFEFKKQTGLMYESEIKETLKTDPGSFTAKLEPLLDDITRPVMASEMEKYTSEESIRESARKEVERFENQLKIASNTGFPELAALMGTRAAENGGVTDNHGKYSKESHLEIPIPVQKLQEEPYFNSYRTVFENATFHMFGDKREYYREDFSNILVYESFKEHIPAAMRDGYRELFEKSYIDHFTATTMHNGAFGSSAEKIEYLNSKGIRVFEKTGELEFKMAGSRFRFADAHGQKINNISSDVQIRYLREHNFTDDRKREGQLQFTVAVERGDYMGAAWLLKKNSAVYALGGIEKNARSELDRAINSLDRNGTARFLLDSALHLFRDQGLYEGHYSGKKAKNKKRRFKRKL